MYPLCHWAVNALAALTSESAGLLRGPRRRKVTWDIQREPGDPGTLG